MKGICPKCGRPGYGPYVRKIKRVLKNGDSRYYFYVYFDHKSNDGPRICYLRVLEPKMLNIRLKNGEIMGRVVYSRLQKSYDSSLLRYLITSLIDFMRSYLVKREKSREPGGEDNVEVIELLLFFSALLSLLKARRSILLMDISSPRAIAILDAIANTINLGDALRKLKSADPLSETLLFCMPGTLPKIAIKVLLIMCALELQRKVLVIETSHASLNMLRKILSVLSAEPKADLSGMLNIMTMDEFLGNHKTLDPALILIDDAAMFAMAGNVSPTAEIRNTPIVISLTSAHKLLPHPRSLKMLGRRMRHITLRLSERFRESHVAKTSIEIVDSKFGELEMKLYNILEREMPGSDLAREYARYGRLVISDILKVLCQNDHRLADEYWSLCQELLRLEDTPHKVKTAANLIKNMVADQVFVVIRNRWTKFKETLNQALEDLDVSTKDVVIIEPMRLVRRIGEFEGESGYSRLVKIFMSAREAREYLEARKSTDGGDVLSGHNLVLATPSTCDYEEAEKLMEDLLLKPLISTI